VSGSLSIRSARKGEAGLVLSFVRELADYVKGFTSLVVVHSDHSTFAVTDAQGRSRLFVTDGSVLVTDGGFNPSLTIQAVAFAAAEYITKQWQGSAWRNGKRG